MESWLPEPDPALLSGCNTTTAVVHVVMAGMAWWYTTGKGRRRDAWMAGLLLLAGAAMHVLGGANHVADSRWVMIARTFCSPLILYGWYRLLKAAAACSAQNQRTQTILEAAATGPATQRLIDARELLERIKTPTPMRS